MRLVNAFSANMLPSGVACTVTFEPVTVDQVRAGPELVSAVGHEDTAARFATLLGRAVPVARVTLTLQPGQRLILGQRRGERLPEGVTTLEDGAEFDWYLVTVEPA